MQVNLVTFYYIVIYRDYIYSEEACERVVRVIGTSMYNERAIWLLK